MDKTLKSILTVVFILVITFSWIYTVSKLTEGASLDLTSNSHYTLTDGSKAIIGSLKQPITMKLFYSEELINKNGASFLAGINNYFYYVRNLVREYERVSNGLIKVHVLDPRPFTDAEEEAELFELRRINFGDGFYFGIGLTTQTGRREAIEYLNFDQQELTEYRITELIDTITRKKRSKVGVLSSMEIAPAPLNPYMARMMQMQGKPVPSPWKIASHLRRFYDLITIPTDSDSIKDVDFLLVVHPKNLEQKTLKAIDQYVLSGGKALFFVDPLCLGDTPPQNPQDQYGASNYSQASDINQLLKAWGVEIKPAYYVNDYDLAQKTRDPRTRTLVRAPAILGLGEDVINKEHIATSGLKQMILLMAGAIETITKDETVTVTPLLKTTKQGYTWTPNNQFETSLRGFSIDVMKKYMPKSGGQKELTLAAMVTGKFKTAFPGAVKSKHDCKGADCKDAAHTEPKLIEQAVNPVNIIVVADVDMLSDQVAYRGPAGFLMVSNDNSSFVLNTLEFMSGSSDLINVRSKGAQIRPFLEVDRIEKEADEKSEEAVKEINAKIEAYRTELSKAESGANQDNVGLLRSDALNAKRELERKIKLQERELRNVNKHKRESVESLGRTIKVINCIGVPFLVLLVGVVLAAMRYKKRVSVIERASK